MWIAWHKHKTTFVWCAVWQYHFVWGGGRSPSPYGLRWSSATPNSVILSPSTPDTGSFVIISWQRKKGGSRGRIADPSIIWANVLTTWLKVQTTSQVASSSLHHLGLSQYRQGINQSSSQCTDPPTMPANSLTRC